MISSVSLPLMESVLAASADRQPASPVRIESGPENLTNVHFKCSALLQPWQL